MAELSELIQEQQREHFWGAIRRDEEQRTRQQRFAKVVGYDQDTGHYLVSEGASGAIPARSLSNSSIPTGTIVSYFVEDGSGVGWIDRQSG